MSAVISLMLGNWSTIGVTHLQRGYALQSMNSNTSIWRVVPLSRPYPSLYFYNTILSPLFTKKIVKTTNVVHYFYSITQWKKEWKTNKDLHNIVTITVTWWYRTRNPKHYYYF
jgi:hypothetical protein